MVSLFSPSFLLGVVKAITETMLAARQAVLCEIYARDGAVNRVGASLTRKINVWRF